MQAKNLALQTVSSDRRQKKAFSDRLFSDRLFGQKYLTTLKFNDNLLLKEQDNIFLGIFVRFRRFYLYKFYKISMIFIRIGRVEMHLRPIEKIRK